MGHPLTLVGFMEMSPTQDACRRALFEQRWREGFRCPRCAHAVAWYLRGRGLLRVRGLRLPGVADRGHAAPQDAHRPAQVAAGDLAAGPQDHAGHAPRRARAAAARRGRARRVAARGGDRADAGGRPRRRAPAPDRRRRRQDPDQGRRRPDPARRRRQERWLQRLPGAARRVHAAGRRRAAALRCTSSPPNFTRWRLDVFQGVSAAHLQSCLDEFC